MPKKVVNLAPSSMHVKCVLFSAYLEYVHFFSFHFTIMIIFASLHFTAAIFSYQNLYVCMLHSCSLIKVENMSELFFRRDMFVFSACNRKNSS